MTKKKQALDDLLQGFIQKFGDSPDNKKTISDEISQFLNSKSKISIKDLDDLEEILLYKLNPSKKGYRKYSLSPIDRITPRLRKFTNSPTILSIKPPDFRNSMRKLSENSVVFTETQGITVSNMKYNRKDNIIFPTEYLPDSYQSKASSPIKNITPSRRNPKANYDEWGKIFKAESIKYERDVELSKRRYKEMKIDYSEQLSRQIDENNKKREVLRQERESETEKVIKNLNDFESFQKQQRNKKYQSMARQKQEYENLIQTKILKYSENDEMVKLDKSSLDKNFLENLIEEKKKFEEKARIKKAMLADNISNANRKRLEKIEEKLRESESDLLHLEKVQKDYSENEERHRRLITSKLSIAHDENRLLKLVKFKPKTLKDYEEEANKQERENLKKIIEEEKE